MAKIKLTKSAVDAAQPQTEAVELKDTLVPGANTLSSSDVFQPVRSLFF